MSTRQPVEQFNAASNEDQSKLGSVSLGLSNAHVCEDRNSTEQDLGLQARFAEGKSIEDWKIERLENFACSTQAVNSMNSYKAQNSDFVSETTEKTSGFQALWQQAQEKLKSELSIPVFETWIKPCRVDSLEGNAITLSTSSDFNREIIANRYRLPLEQTFSALIGQPVSLQLRVDERLSIPQRKPEQPSLQVTGEPKPSAPYVSPVVNPKYPLARFQNPTNNPEVAILLEKYGDLRQVILKSPLFEVPCKPVAEGGWGTGIGGLISLAKEYTLERVLWAVKETKAYRGTREPGKYFNHIVRKGLETDSCS